MQLPLPLREALEEEAARLRPDALARAARELSENYRAGSAALVTEAHRIAYSVVRMPATYAAAYTVLQEIAGVQSKGAFGLDAGTPITSLLDLGAGPGTVMWAVREIFGELRTITLIEQDKDLITLGKRIAPCAATWQALDLREARAFEKHDLVVCSYVLSEMGERTVLRAAWDATGQILAVIEPGTPAGFSLIRAVRAEMIAMGANLVAPCPHARECPMRDPDWCHFSQRIERTAAHRRAKGGTMGYEDEKFSYAVFSKLPASPSAARILRHPYKGHGYVQLSLCAPSGLSKITITKKDKEAYKKARKARWGQVLGR